MADRMSRLSAAEVAQVEQGLTLLLDVFDVPTKEASAKKKVANPAIRES
jgi:hypothetical protein